MRVALVDGEFVLNPTHTEREKATMELIVAGCDDRINMMEFEGAEIAEEKIVEAVAFAQESIRTTLEMQRELVEKFGVEKAPWEKPHDVSALVTEVEKGFLKDLQAAKQVAGKIARQRDEGRGRTRPRGGPGRGPRGVGVDRRRFQAGLGPSRRPAGSPDAHGRPADRRAETGRPSGGDM